MNLTPLALPLTDYRPVITSFGGPPGLGNGSTVHALVLADGHPALIPLLQQVSFTADLLCADERHCPLPTALALLSTHGEGIILSHEPLQSDRVWAQIATPAGVANYFAKSKQANCYRATANTDDQLVSKVWELKRDRLHYRTGAETRSYLQSPHTVTAWDAASAEAQQTNQPRYNLSLSAKGVTLVQLTPFDRLSKKFNGSLDALLALNGKEIQSIIRKRPQRQLLAAVLAAGHCRIDPKVVAAYQTGLRAAIAQVQALRAGIPATDLPMGLNAELRPYQKDGFDFLCHLSRITGGGILADDMGLGKTLQTLTWLLWLKTNFKSQISNLKLPSLVVCPASVMHNWRREAEKFTPGLKVLVLESGAQRATQLTKLSQFDLVITNYALLRRDLAALTKLNYAALILDEAQFIKNPGAQVTKAVKMLAHGAQHRLALTGTPLENKLLDLWSIADFVAPGYLGTQQQFKDDAITTSDLKRRLKPILLRRLKIHVAKDLPARIELRRDCSLGTAQMAFYRQELQRSREEVMSVVNQKGLKQSKLHVLAALMRLRQICCHPALVDGGRHTLASGKTETFFELLDDLRAAGKKVLVFSQFTKMLAVLQTECRTRGIPTHLLTGETQDRQAVVDAFNSGPPQGVFLLSLRAAGTGLNLTTASEVILYDPWWNPAVEAQAIDRSHRIGQTCTVNAHRLITRNTIEERIWTIQQAKARTIDAVLGEGGFTRSLTKTDLEYLFGGVEGETVVPKIETVLNESETMIPRHESNRPNGRRNTRASHPVIPAPVAVRKDPLWRQRRSQDARALPLWRANYGLTN